MSESPVGDIIMLLSIHFYLLVKEMSGWIYVPSRAAWVGWTSCTHTSTLKLLIFHLLFFYLKNTLQKVHILERSRVGWDTTISNYSWTLPLSQTPPAKPQLLTSALLWFIRNLFFSVWPSFTAPAHLMLNNSSSAPGSISLDTSGQGGKAGVTVEDRGGQGTQGLLLHSAIDTRTSLTHLCVTLGRAKPWPEAFYLLGAQSLGTASVLMWFLEVTNQKNHLHLAFLEGTAFVGQLEKWWHYKNQSDHRAPLREEMLRFALHWARNVPLLKRYLSVPSICLLFWWQTVLILVSVSAHISQWLLNNH